MLRMVAKKTTNQGGCIECCLLREMDSETSIRFEGRWEHYEDMERYICSNLFSALFGATHLLIEPCEVVIVEELKETSIELIRSR